MGRLKNRAIRFNTIVVYDNSIADGDDSGRYYRVVQPRRPPNPQRELDRFYSMKEANEAVMAAQAWMGLIRTMGMFDPLVHVGMATLRRVRTTSGKKSIPVWDQNACEAIRRPIAPILQNINEPMSQITCSKCGVLMDAWQSRNMKGDATVRRVRQLRGEILGTREKKTFPKTRDFLGRDEGCGPEISKLLKGKVR